MSDTEETKEPRRLIHIRPNEVSLVDYGANGKTFAVMKRLEDGDMGERTKIDLGAAKAEDEDKEEMEKDAAPATDAGDVVGDAAKAEDEETEEASDEASEDDAEKGKGLEAAVGDLAPWLQAQLEGASDEDKALIMAVLENMGEEEAPPADEADDAEKATDELAELKAAVKELQAAQSAKADGGEEEEEPAEKKVSKADTRYVTKADFDAFKGEIMGTLKDAVTGVTSVAKRLSTIESTTQPVSKSADDIVPPSSGKDDTKKSDDELFGGVINFS